MTIHEDYLATAEVAAFSAIYDDRVASGLGWLVVQHAESQGYKAVPEVLRFTVKSGKKTNRSSAYPSEVQDWGRTTHCRICVSTGFCRNLLQLSVLRKLLVLSVARV